LAYPRHTPDGARQARVCGRIAAVASSAARRSAQSHVSAQTVVAVTPSDGSRTTSIATP